MIPGVMRHAVLHGDGEFFGYMLSVEVHHDTQGTYSFAAVLACHLDPARESW